VILHNSNVFAVSCVDFNGSYCVNDRRPFHICDSSTDVSCSGRYKTWNFELGCLIIGWILNRFFCPSDVSLEVLIKCRNLQMISYLSSEMTEPATGVAAS
jgi:hypothetical protein